MAESKARNTDDRYSKLTIGVCPDQWGVWFPEDEKQIHWETALDEMAEAGFSVMETGPFGYFPKDPKRLQEEMDKRGFTVVAGTGWGILHKPEAWADTEKTFREIAETHAAVGATYIVHLPPMFRDEKTWDYTDDRVLSTEAWNAYISNADKLGRIMKEDYGLQMVLHPHGDSHIETPDDIDRVFQATDPDYVGFCLDTGHIVYGGGDPMELCRTYPERISYVHIKAMDEGLVKQAHDEDWPFGLAVAKGCSVAPPAGAPDMPAFVEALADLDKELYVVCEQDMYPCDRPCRCPTPSRPASTSPPSASASAEPLHSLTKESPMTVRIGMIGPGGMGQAHIDRIHTVIADGRVVAVSDVDPARAAEVASRIDGTAYASSAELIAADEVDAVMICSYGPAHEVDVLAAIAAGKPVFCEKPLTPTAEAALRIMEAEQAGGRRLVTVGFMRRFDRSYREMKALLDSGELGETLMVHCAHRNPTVPEHYTWDMAINDTAIHEVDTMRWLLGEEFVSARVDKPKKTSLRFEHLQDPLVLVLETESGVRVDDEIFVNCQFGYDIRCEAVAEKGTVSLGDQNAIVVRDGVGVRNAIARDHNDRFWGAFVTEVQEWISAVARGEHTGSTSWDGYAAACVCDAGVRALTDEGVVKVEMIAKPDFYA
ncbi:TIM barrel protein [Terrabacter sp. Soil810]|uniref:TIM barrel protein n=2 Tax=unclassified Terrabacter TaxID=2630222 RepID=UPI0026997B51